VYTDGGTWYDNAWKEFGLKRSLFQKNLMERVNQYFNDRRASFDVYYYLCIQKEECNLMYIHNWIHSFESVYNK
jgi:hypothetical protein